MKRAGTFYAKANAKKGEMYIYDEISRWGISADSFSKEMRALGGVEEIDFYVNSPGGSVFDGIAICNQIARHPARAKNIHIDGIAASIASVIIMAGTSIKAAANATVMIHDPFGVMAGTAEGMRKMANALDLTRGQILDTYVQRTKGDREELSNWMTEETWMNAETALARGFVDEITDAVEIEASFPMLEKFAKLPQNLRKQAMDTRAQMARVQAAVARVKAGRVSP